MSEEGREIKKPNEKRDLLKDEEGQIINGD